jgi:hypothetical protein
MFLTLTSMYLAEQRIEAPAGGSIEQRKADKRGAEEPLRRSEAQAVGTSHARIRPRRS